jgi:hypothetical protein
MECVYGIMFMELSFYSLLLKISIEIIYNFNVPLYFIQ